MAEAATHIVLLPLILVRRPAGGGRFARTGRGLVFGGGSASLLGDHDLGPAGVALNNRGFQTGIPRRARLIRLAESGMTAIASSSPACSAASLALVPGILPSILIAVPIGAFVIRRVNSETFRRVCMSFDAWIVSFGISTLLRDLQILAGYRAYSVMVAVILIDAWLLYRFFGRPRRPQDNVK